jgi:hypothetical protein
MNPRLAAVARERGVEPEWLQLISEGSLDSPEFVRAIRTAASLQMWDLVSPAVREALFVPELQVKAFGGSLDQLLEQLEVYSLEQIKLELELLRQARLQDDADLGRKVRSNNKAMARRAREPRDPKDVVAIKALVAKYPTEGDSDLARRLVGRHAPHDVRESARGRIRRLRKKLDA